MPGLSEIDYEAVTLSLILARTQNPYEGNRTELKKETNRNSRVEKYQVNLETWFANPVLQIPLYVPCFQRSGCSYPPL